MSRRRPTHGHETVKLPRTELGLKPLVNAEERQSPALVVLQGAECDLGNQVWVDRTITLGRDPQIELPLDDELISRRHCRVVPQPDGSCLLEDLRSRNGTQLNGEQVVERALLKQGDRIQLGGVIVKFTSADDLELVYHKEMNERLGTDELTGLISKRRFDAALLRALTAARSMRVPLSLLMLDLDGLKQINDAHGHPVGASTISSVGRIIGEVVSPHGAACRVGGDEFVAFLRGLTKQVAVDFAESIRTWVSTHRFETDGIVVSPTISIGVAAFPADGKSAERLIMRADEALYRAKSEGKNRVCY